MVAIAFTGGGTGGHVYPGLALVSYIRELLKTAPSGEGDCRIFWIGSTKGKERAMVEGVGLEYFGIPSGKLRRNFSPQNFLDLFKVAAGFFAARRILKREKPVLLFSKGGFVSVPPCAAAASLGIPVFTHESDYSPGLATRINARFAKKIFVPYEKTRLFFGEKYRDRVLVTGNPVRPEFQQASAEQGRAILGTAPGERILLVLGGSLGAREINELIRETLPELTKIYTVVHQTGKDAAGPRPGEEYKSGDRYIVYPYINEEMPHILAAAELVICRSGAGTLWEAAVLGRPMVMIPLRGSGTRGDQVENARFFEEAGMGGRLPAERSPADWLVETVRSLAADPARREAMSAAALRFAAIDAGERIAGILVAGSAPVKEGR